MLYVVIVHIFNENPNKFKNTQIWYYVTDKMCITQPFDPCMGCLPLKIVISCEFVFFYFGSCEKSVPTPVNKTLTYKWTEMYKYWNDKIQHPLAVLLFERTKSWRKFVLFKRLVKQVLNIGLDILFLFWINQIFCEIILGIFDLKLILNQTEMDFWTNSIIFAFLLFQ